MAYSHVAIFEAFERLGYLGLLTELSDTLDGELWIVGGWIRSAFLGHDSYVGDVDCLSPIPLKGIVALLRAKRYPLLRNAHGGIRLILPDHNHIDLGSTESFAGSQSVADALEQFNFSVNSAALNVRTRSTLWTNRFLEDIDSRCFRVNCPIDPKSAPALGLFKDFEILVRYYKMSPIHEPYTNQVLASLRDEQARVTGASPRENLIRTEQYIAPLIPEDERAWIVRGYPRVCVLRDLQYWDDVDVVTTAARHELINRIECAGYQYGINFFGYPKILHPSGVTIDIWTLRPGSDLLDELSSYAHNVDSIAWSIEGHEFMDPLQVQCEIATGRVDISGTFLGKADIKDLSYGAVKTMYLCLRHGLEPQKRALDLMRSQIRTDGLLVKNTIKLIQDLWCARGDHAREAFRQLKAEIGGSATVQLFDEHFISRV